eukprot:jgi/Mesvir1/1771/Mv09621-RA.1
MVLSSTTLRHSTLVPAPNTFIAAPAHSLDNGFRTVRLPKGDTSSILVIRNPHTKRAFSGVVRAAAEPTVEPAVSGTAGKNVVLGVYTFGSGEGCRAAPVDVATGEFEGGGATCKIETKDEKGLEEALIKIVEKLEWTGDIGCGLPGIVAGREDQGYLRTDRATKRSQRVQLERRLRAALDRNVVVMTGAEANGYGELSFGAGKEYRNQLVMMCTMGVGLGVALFDEGVLVRNLDVRDITWTWGGREWEGSPRPSPDSDDIYAIKRWAKRINFYLSQLEDRLQPNLIIIGGSAALTADKVIPNLYLKTKVVPGALGHLAGVKGAAIGAHYQLKAYRLQEKLAEAFARVEGRRLSMLSEADIYKVFELMDGDHDGILVLDEMMAAAARMGLVTSRDEMNLLMEDLDVDNVGGVTRDVFRKWFAEVTMSGNKPVTLIMSEEELDEWLEEAEDRLVVLQVGFTFCRPCKAFKKKYSKLAERFSSAKFLRVDGNQNASTIRLGKDRLQVKSSPAFFFFRDKKIVHSFTGANEERFVEAMLKHGLKEGEAGFVDVTA